jgi:hypothetical protein
LSNRQVCFSKEENINKNSSWNITRKSLPLKWSTVLALHG